MATVASGAAMSLDGFIADPSGDVGPLFEWYFSGEVEVPTAGPWVFKVSEPSARVLRGMLENCGALVVGGGEFDKTHGWGGRHPMGAPVFVLTHQPPDAWPFPDTPEAEDMPFTFVTDGIGPALLFAGVLSMLAACGGQRLDLAGPLRCGPYPFVPESAGSVADVGKPFTFADVLLWDRGTEPATLDRVGLIRWDPRLHVVGA